VTPRTKVRALAVALYLVGGAGFVAIRLHVDTSWITVAFMCGAVLATGSALWSMAR